MLELMNKRNPYCKSFPGFLVSTQLLEVSKIYSGFIGKYLSIFILVFEIWLPRFYGGIVNLYTRMIRPAYLGVLLRQPRRGFANRIAGLVFPDADDLQQVEI